MASSLKEASAYIYAGKVLANEQRIQKPGDLLSPLLKLRVKGENRSKFVGRGGHKLQSAIETFNMRAKFEGKVVLDVGASTGGFTDCVLRLGAGQVLALDVGTNQLAWSLRSHPRVVVLENMDIRDFKRESFPAIDWILADVSFNSLSKLAPSLQKACTKTTDCLVLVKPQFELPNEKIPAGGIVTDPSLWENAVSSVLKAFENLGAKDFRQVKSAIKGREGNQEFFLYFKLDSNV